MRYVQILIPEGKRDSILDQLDKEGIDYAVTEETGRHGYVAVVSFPVPASAVGQVLDRLREAGVEEKAFTIVLKPEVVVSHHFKKLKNRYQKDEISREELLARAEEMAPSLSTFLIMTSVSALIAATGLLTNSAAVIIGAMVIAPLMGPAIAASVGTVINDPKLYWRGFKLQSMGIGVAIATAAIFAILLKQSALIPPGLDITTIPEVQERLAPNFLAAAIAIGAGIAAVVSLARGTSSVMVGAMIAVALVPPAATVGLSLAWWRPLAMLGAGVLLLVNVISINLAALSLFWLFGYRPENWGQVDSAKSKTIKRIMVLVAVMLLLSIVLGSVTYVTFKSAGFEHRAKREARAVLKKARFKDAKLLSISINFRIVDVLFFDEKPVIVMQVDTPGGNEIPGLARAVRERIEKVAVKDVKVQVRFIRAVES